MVSGAKSSLRCLPPTTHPVCSAKQLMVESNDAEEVMGWGRVGHSGSHRHTLRLSSSVLDPYDLLKDHWNINTPPHPISALIVKLFIWRQVTWVQPYWAERDGNTKECLVFSDEKGFLLPTNQMLPVSISKTAGPCPVCWLESPAMLYKEPKFESHLQSPGPGPWCLCWGRNPPTIFRVQVEEDPLIPSVGTTVWTRVGELANPGKVEQNVEWGARVPPQDWAVRNWRLSWESTRVCLSSSGPRQATQHIVCGGLRRGWERASIVL